MSIIKLTSDNFQNYELVANPRKTFESSSHGASYDARITGSIALFADASPSMKDIDPTFGEAEEGFDDTNIEETRINAFADPTEASLEHYMSSVNSHPQGDRQNKRQEVLRFIPGAKPDKNFMSKGVIKNTLFKHYANQYQSLDWAYTNYNCLHFFRSDALPNDTALIYPSMTGSADGVNYYAPSSSFTFDFYIKPKVPNTFQTTDVYKPGTILHMSSCYAISLVTGSSRGHDGLADKFRILLQLSQSADIKPSICVLGETEVTAPSTTDRAWLFSSKDNSLKRDNWHHVSIRWPGGKTMGSTGSILIDGKVDSYFMCESGSVMQHRAPNGLTSDDPNAVFVGNYYEGKNTGGSAISRYFGSTVSTDQGLTPIDAAAYDADPTGIILDHVLNAEVHDIKIYDTHKSITEIKKLGKRGPDTLEGDLLFYVPPYFTEYTRNRLILQTPFFDVTGSSEDPFNTALSFGIGGLEINLENFTREFVKKEYPRLLNMTSSRIDTSATEEGHTSDMLLYLSLIHI